MKSRLDKVANFALVGAALFLGVNWIRHSSLNYRPKNEAASKRVALEPGVQFSLEGWHYEPKGRLGLILALNTRCPYSLRSAGFYRDLAGRAARSGRVKLLAVLDEGPAQSEAYLRSLGVRVSEIRQIPLEKLGITATPTLILLDGQAKIQAIWIGMLRKDQQGVVMEWVEGVRTQENPAAGPLAGKRGKEPLGPKTFVSAAHFLQIARKAQVLDVREPDEFAQGHIAGALNISPIELPAFAKRVLSVSTPVVLYCGRLKACQSSVGRPGWNLGLCRPVLEYLKEVGFREVRILNEGLEACQAKGIPMSASLDPQYF